MVLSIMGVPLGGFLADAWYKKRKNARSMFPAVSSFISAVLILSAFVFFEGTAQFILLIICGITVPAFIPASVAVTQDVIHPGLRAMSLSLCVIIQHLLGSSTAPIVIGALSDSLGIKTAMMFLAIAPAMAGIFYLFRGRLCRD